MPYIVIAKGQVIHCWNTLYKFEAFPENLFYSHESKYYSVYFMSISPFLEHKYIIYRSGIPNFIFNFNKYIIDHGPMSMSITMWTTGTPFYKDTGHKAATFNTIPSPVSCIWTLREILKNWDTLIYQINTFLSCILTCPRLAQKSTHVS